MVAPVIIPPKPATLAKYDLTADEWGWLLARQGGVCAICFKVPKGGRFNVDHQHGRQRGKRWKDLPPAERRATVRGILCPMCNMLILGRGVTVAKLRAAADYLERWQAARSEAA